MVVLRIGRVERKAFDGTTFFESVSIEHETEKAILLKIDRGKPRIQWIPKQFCKVRSRAPLRYANGKLDTGKEVKEIFIEDWFYEKNILVAVI